MTPPSASAAGESRRETKPGKKGVQGESTGAIAIYRDAVSQNRGDSERGKQVFEDMRTAACVQCHTTDGRGGKCGPDLLGIGDKYSQESLMTAILEPSVNILPGYRTTVALLRSGKMQAGILKQRDPDHVQLVDAQNKRITLKTADIVELKANDTSLMPQGVHRSISAQDCAALIAYLETLRQPPLEDLAREGMPDEIPQLEKPIEFIPWHGLELRFDKPTWFGPMPEVKDAFVVLEHQTARIWLLGKGADGDQKTLFVDLGEQVSDGPWEGLMSIAFHPDFRQNRKYYLKHEVIENGQRSTVVVERRAASDFRSDAGCASRRLLKIDQPADNHNGGTIAFGPDGYLYIGMGDGGPQEDPNGYAQNLGEFLGSMLRIDVDGHKGDKPYGIPSTNPWAQHGSGNFRPEIWATGLREPWRFTFDRVTGDLWVGDVGQNRIEEVTIVRAGENHGWNVYEGFVSFSDRYKRDTEVYVPPVFAYPRKHGVSVTGGYVYRGDKKSSFYGVYVFGDFESRRVWGLTQENRRLTKVREIGQSPAKIASFGQDHAGNLYLVGYDGIIYRLDLSQTQFK